MKSLMLVVNDIGVSQACTALSVYDEVTSH